MAEIVHLRPVKVQRPIIPVVTPDEAMKKRASDKLYLLLPNHQCPKKDCPFHVPLEVKTKLADEPANETLTKLQQIGAVVDDGGNLSMPPLHRKTDFPETDEDVVLTKEEHLTDITVDTGEEVSDYESVITLDSGVGRERDDFGLEFSDTESQFMLPSPEIVHHLRESDLGHIDEDEEMLKDGQEIKEDARHRLTYKDGVATLLITNLQPEDEDQYTCQAANNLGDTETMAYLTVEEVRHRRKRKEDVEATMKIKHPKPDEAAVLEGNMPPEFTLPLIDQMKQAGEDVEFSVTVTCRPEPELKWFCNDQPVLASPRHTFEHAKGVYHLTVHDLVPEDGGEWKCLAVSPFGQSWCSCDLKVLESIPEDHRAPRFARELDDLTVTIGSVAQLECEVIGFPQPTIEWYKDRRRIESDKHYVIETDNNLCMLKINGAEYEDSGAYLCRAINDAGAIATEARIRVQSVRDTVMRPDRPFEFARVETTPSARYKFQVAPDFTVKLKNKRVPEGLSVHLNCSVTGIPEPRARWFRDGQEIFEGVDYSMRNNYGLLTLEIQNARPEHAGTYSCEASNDEGNVTCSATLEVEREEELEAVELEFLRPKFLITLEDITVNEGEDVTFRCKAVGKPMPHFKWNKDMLELSSSSRLLLTSDGSGLATLTIRKVRPSDAGLYFVLAHSRSGRSKSSATLRVRAKSKSPITSPEVVEYGRPSYEGAYLPLQQVSIPGKPPSFSIMLPAHLNVHEGEKLRLDCSVQGLPTPIVTWSKGHRGLMYGQRHRIMFVGSLHTLEIPSTMALDKGEYIVRATNAFGCVETACQVNVLPPREKGEAEPVLGDVMQLEATPKTKMGEDVSHRGKAPFFIKHLPRTVEVMEGTNLRLDCILRRGVELVQWSQDDIDRSKQGLEAEGYEGDYVPFSDQTLGTSSTSPRSTDVDSFPPSFKTTLHDLVLPAGSLAMFECVTTGSQTTPGKWYKDGNPLAVNECVHITSDGTRHRLVISAIVKSDEGEYTYEATSAAGSASCSATLTIQVLTEKGLLTRKQSIEHKRKASPEADKTLSKFAKFTRELPTETTASPGENVTLSCSFPEKVKDVYWEKNGSKLLDSAHIASSQSADGTLSLKLVNLQNSDTGNYRCIVIQNDGTQAQTSTLLTVLGTEAKPDDCVAPLFVRKLSDQKIHDGDTVILDCCIEGNPRPQVTWLHNGAEIFDNQDILISTIGSDCKLQILDVYPEDEGQYTCIASNSAGEAMSTCYIYVEDAYMSGDSESSFAAQSYGSTRGKRDPNGNASKLGLKEVEAKLDIGNRRLPSPDIKKVEKDRAPEFVIKPRRQFIDEGQDAKFKVSFDGSPSTKLTWTKDGKTLYCSSKYKIYEQSGYHFLEVLNVASEDSGLYVGTITNSAGTDTASAEIDVFAKPKLLTRNIPPPAVLSPLHDHEVTIGDHDIKLECKVENGDSCDVSWFHNGKELHPGHHYSCRYNGTVASLIIVEIGEEDFGFYECVISNVSGEARTRCSLIAAPVEKFEAPVFIKELHDMEVEDGDKVELVVEVKDSDLSSSEEFK